MDITAEERYARLSTTSHLYSLQGMWPEVHSGSAIKLRSTNSKTVTNAFVKALTFWLFVVSCSIRHHNVCNLDATSSLPILLPCLSGWPHSLTAKLQVGPNGKRLPCHPGSFGAVVHFSSQWKSKGEACTAAHRAHLLPDICLHHPFCSAHHFPIYGSHGTVSRRNSGRSEAHRMDQRPEDFPRCLCAIEGWVG